MQIVTQPLRLPQPDFCFLLERLGPSLGLWRAAEVAALREQAYAPPVLDLGCGDGLVTSLVLPAAEVGLDPDAAALEHARRRGLYHRLVDRPAETSGLEAGSFGTVVSNSVLEHLPQVDAVLAAAARLLRPGGRLVFTTPSDAFSHWLALPSARYAAWRNRGYGHHNLWPASRWAQHLLQAGLEVETVRPYLRRSLVSLWDGLDLSQQVWVGRRRLVGVLWKRLSPAALDRLAARMARLDLAAGLPGGGQLIVARKRE